MAFITQIIKTQIKRFYSHEIVEYDKNVDPRNKEDSEDKVIIALMWALLTNCVINIFLSFQR